MFSTFAAKLRKDTAFARIQQIGWRVSEAELRKDTGYRGKGERSRVAPGYSK